MPYYNLFNLLTFENIYKFKTAIFGHKLIANEPNVSSVFLEYLTPISEIHGHYTRYSGQRNLYRPKIRTNYGRKTFQFFYFKNMGTVPSELKSLNSVQFKVQYKKRLLQSQYPQL